MLWHMIHFESKRDKCISKATILSFRHILFIKRDEIIGYRCRGEALVIQYNSFRI